jgi:hypothetical protein
MAALSLDITAKIPIVRIPAEPEGEGEKHRQNHIIKPVKLDLPQPSFRKISRDSNYMKRTYTARKHFMKKLKDGESKDSYFHYEEPSLEELNKRVEYDMDLEDINWLEDFNKAYGHTLRISDSDFEKIMDRLEKESYFDTLKSGQNPKHDVDEDAVCAVCDNGDCNNANAIIFCDMCDLAVHQECYGVPYVPLGQWLCKRCQLSPAQNVECCLCPNLGGAFKQTEITDISTANDNNNDPKKHKLKNKKGWAHVVCALWVPEVSFANTVFLEPIEGIENIDAARWKLKCYICNQRYKGACIQCSKPNCYQPFHVTCAKQAGLFMRISPYDYERDGETFSDVRRMAYCDKHTPPGENKKGGMYSGDETDEDFDSERYRKKEMFRKKNIRKTREKLAQQLVEYQREAASVKVDEDKLRAIAGDLGVRGKRTHVNSKLDQARLEYVQRIHAYWLHKRKARNGVPLIRRLQVNFSPRTDLQLNRSLEADKYTSLRYDLEKSRLLLNMLKRREHIKGHALKKSMEIVKCYFDVIDAEEPADED